MNTKDIEMPMATKDIKQFEKKNPDYIINVYSCNPDGTNIQPRMISKIRDYMDLVGIKDFSAHFAVMAL